MTDKQEAEAVAALLQYAPLVTNRAGAARALAAIQQDPAARAALVAVLVPLDVDDGVHPTHLGPLPDSIYIEPVSPEPKCHWDALPESEHPVRDGDRGSHPHALDAHGVALYDRNPEHAVTATEPTPDLRAAAQAFLDAESEPAYSWVHESQRARSEGTPNREVERMDRINAARRALRAALANTGKEWVR